jgi:hypothetical protein
MTMAKPMIMQEQWKIKNGDRFFARSESQADPTAMTAAVPYIGTCYWLARSGDMCV